MTSGGDAEWVWVESGVSPPPPPTLTVEANPEVGRLLGPDGRLAKIVRAKPDRPAGFRPGGAR